MTKRRSTRIVLSAIAFVGLIAWVVVVDLGVFAGRIYHGVSVAGVDLGGLTQPEAEDALEARAEDLRAASLTFTRDDVNASTSLARLGWLPLVRETAEAAKRIGRDGAPFGALADRVRTWFTPVKLRWVGEADPELVGKFVRYVDRVGEEAGMDVDKPKLRYKIKRATNTWPPQPFYAIPLLD